MKQKFLMLLAVVLLSFASAFAQSGNNEPLKGDVNEDGKVDVADIVAIIEIMKNNEVISSFDYYVGWTNGSYSAFAAKTDAEMINGATGYASVNNPTYTRAFGDNNIFYLMYQPNHAPTQVIFTSQGQAIVQDIVNDNICPHADVVIDGVTYKVFGIRMATGYDPTDMMTVTFEAVQPQYKTVQVGHGTDYANAVFSDTGRQLSNNMYVTIDTNAGDYRFIKVDKRDTVNNLYLYNAGAGIFEYMEIALNAPVIDGDYKYYQSTNRYNAGERVPFVINKE